MDIKNRIFIGNNLITSQKLPPKSVNTIVTSPPYWGLRDYGTSGQLGHERTPEEYVQNLVKLFGPGHLWDVLRDDGTLWLNIGDSYYRTGAFRGGGNDSVYGRMQEASFIPNRDFGHLKPKDLVGIPWLVAFALQKAGWYLRRDIIWSKPNCQPEPVKDRPTESHEYIFLFSKSPDYYYDADAIAEYLNDDALEIERRQRSSIAAALGANISEGAQKKKKRTVWKTRGIVNGESVEILIPDDIIDKCMVDGQPLVELVRNELLSEENEIVKTHKTSVWHVKPHNHNENHPAVYPPDLIEPCILAGCPKGGVVLDPFFGSGTTGLVARACGRNFTGLEISATFALESALPRVGGEIVKDFMDLELVYEEDPEVITAMRDYRERNKKAEEEEKAANEKPKKEKVEKAQKEPKEKTPKSAKPDVNQRLASIEL